MTVILSGTSFLCCCTASAMDLKGLFFPLSRFLPYTSTRNLAQPDFFKASLGAGSSSLKVTEPPTEVRNTDLAYLFVWITQCSAKGISR